MATTYPSQVDTLITLPEVNSSTGLRPELFNRLREAIIRVEEELGAKPSATFGTVRTRLDYLEYRVSSGLVNLTGDLGGAPDDVRVIGIKGNPIQDVPLLSNGQTLVWDSHFQYWIPSFVSASTLIPPLATSLTPGEPVLLEVNSSLINPTFTADYSVDTSQLQSVLITDNQGSAQYDATATPNFFIYNNTYNKNNYGETVTITSTVFDNNFKTTTNSVTFTWVQNVYWGAHDTPMSYDSPFITSLSNKELSTSYAKTISVTAGVGQYIYFAFRQDYITAYGEPTFTVNEISGGFSAVISGITINGEDFVLYRSDQSGLGQTTVFIS